MTRQKHFKQLVRERMTKTGESYSSARRRLLGDADGNARQSPKEPHFAGSVPAATALRIALTRAGVRDPGTKQPFTEAMVFGIAGGIGIGTFSFVYDKADVATFYITGRHMPHDDLAYLKNACNRMGIEPIVVESTGEKKAAAALAAMLDEHGPCIAWVDAASLPHRAMPELYRGGGYHIVTVYSISGDAALIGDLTDAPVSIPLADLAAARGRIKKQKNRLLCLPQASGGVSTADALREGLRACHLGLTGKLGIPNFATNFSLESLRKWGEDLHGKNNKESWEQRFTPGGRLWQGLTSIHDFIEHYGSGGSLCRPMFATCLAESADLLGGSPWKSLSERYTDLGLRWSELAQMALPDDVPMFHSAKELLTRKAELINSGGSEDEVRGIWRELDQLSQQAKREFPLPPDDCSHLRARLKEHVLALHAGETAAHEELGRLVG